MGTGRLIFSLNHGEAEFEAVVDRFIAACLAMKADGWWWHEPVLTNNVSALSASADANCAKTSEVKPAGIRDTRCVLRSASVSAPWQSS